jgi:(R,R)-butanediol dehydrogenase/meso-butanediol dehydrogenase/diacetyl reductase
MGTKIARLAAHQRIRFDEVELPDPGPGQVKVQFEQAAVCGSEVDLFVDMQFWADVESGKAEVPPIGHEAVGLVTAIGEGVDTLAPGTRVVPWFERGFGRAHGPVPNGFAEAAILDASDCVEVGNNNRFAVVAEPIGCAVNTVEATGPRLGDHVVVVGTGFIAQIVVLLSHLRGAASVTVFGRRDVALDRIRQIVAAQPGAARTRILERGTVKELDEVKRLTGQAGADVVYEVTGAEEGLNLATKLVRPGDVSRQGGKLSLGGFHRIGRRQVDLARIGGGAIQLVNCHFRKADVALAGMAAGVRLVEAGVLDLGAVRLDGFPFEHLDEAFKHASTRPGGLGRAIVTFG